MSLIAIDAVGVRSGGGARTLLDLLGALTGSGRGVAVRLFVSPRENRSFELPTVADRTVEERPREDRNLARRLARYMGGSSIVATSWVSRRFSQ